MNQTRIRSHSFPRKSSGENHHQMNDSTSIILKTSIKPSHQALIFKRLLFIRLLLQPILFVPERLIYMQILLFYFRVVTKRSKMGVEAPTTIWVLSVKRLRGAQNCLSHQQKFSFQPFFATIVICTSQCLPERTRKLKTLDDIFGGLYRTGKLG